MHPRNFGSDKIIRTYVSMYVHPFHVKGFEMSHILAWSPITGSGVQLIEVRCFFFC